MSEVTTESPPSGRLARSILLDHRRRGPHLRDGIVGEEHRAGLLRADGRVIRRAPRCVRTGDDDVRPHHRGGLADRRCALGHARSAGGPSERPGRVGRDVRLPVLRAELCASRGAVRNAGRDRLRVALVHPDRCARRSCVPSRAARVFLRSPDKWDRPRLHPSRSVVDLAGERHDMAIRDARPGGRLRRRVPPAFLHRSRRRTGVALSCGLTTQSRPRNDGGAERAVRSARARLHGLRCHDGLHQCSPHARYGRSRRDLDGDVQRDDFHRIDGDHRCLHRRPSLRSRVRSRHPACRLSASWLGGSSARRRSQRRGGPLLRSRLRIELPDDRRCDNGVDRRVLPRASPRSAARGALGRPSGRRRTEQPGRRRPARPRRRLRATSPFCTREASRARYRSPSLPVSGVRRSARKARDPRTYRCSTPPINRRQPTRSTT